MCPGITDNAARGQNSSILPGEGNEAARRGGRRPRAMMNRIRRPTRCGRRCQEMIATKCANYRQAFSPIPATRQINTSAASLGLARPRGPAFQVGGGWKSQL